MKNIKKYEVIIFCLYLLLMLVGILNHEMYIDELQTWQIVNNSHSLVELYHNKAYETHPMLWYLMLYPVTWLFSDPFSMQVLQLLSAAFMAVLLLFYSPFSKLNKTLLLFGYFFAFEYGVLARNYMIGIALMFVFCIYFSRDSKYRLYILASVLFLIMSSNTMVAMLSAGLWILVFSDWKSVWKKYSNIQWAYYFLIPFIGFVLSIYTSTAVNDSGYLKEDVTHLSYNSAMVGFALATLTKAYLPLPDFRLYEFWDTNFINEADRWMLGTFFTMGLIGLFAYYFRKVFVIQLAYLGITFGLLFFFYHLEPANVRHHGHYFILFVALWWIYQATRPVPSTEKVDVLSSRIITGVLVFQVIAAAFTLTMDIRYPFSNIKLAAEDVRSRNLPEYTLVTDMPWSVTNISAYLDNREVFNIGTNMYCRYMIWKKYVMPSNEQTLDAIEKIRKETNKPVLLFTVPTLKTTDPRMQRVKLLKTYDRSLSGMEWIKVYWYE